jgi:Transposase DDE domain
MDHDQWTLICRHLRHAAAMSPRSSRRFHYSDTLIVGMYLWAVAHDRPMCWACDRAHYNAVFRPRQLPSVSQFHRRVKSDRVRAILQRIHDATGGRSVPTALSSVDGKALPISPVSKDPDARHGYAGARQMGHGYKLHALASEDRRIVTWCVRPMNEHEMPVARQLLRSLPEGFFSARSVLLADGNYDSHDLHKDVARLGGHLVTHLRGRACHAVTLRQMGAARRELLRVDRTARPLLRMVRRHRNEIELTFSNLTSYGGGLGPLPPFVRRLPRVTRWVGAKIILYHTRLQLRRSRSRGK